MPLAVTDLVRDDPALIQRFWSKVAVGPDDDVYMVKSGRRWSTR